MSDPISVTVSFLAFGVSTVTAWLTLFRRGTVKMTQPTVIFPAQTFPGHATSFQRRKVICEPFCSQHLSAGASFKACMLHFPAMRRTRISTFGFTVRKDLSEVAACLLVKQV
jgi:hypothetical protein